MPLLPGKSKKSFSKNVKTEMEHGKPQDQALAIAFSVKRKGKKKKMAEGGSVSASNERRPMPDNRYDDSKMVSRNSGNKPAKNDSWTDNSTIKQAQSNNGRKVLPIKRPKMVPTNAFSTRMYDEEAHLQESASPGPYREQPPEHDNELDAKKSGHPVRDMEREHNNGKEPYKMAIEDQYSEDEAEEDMKQRYAKGGRVMPDMEPEDHDIEMRERSDEAHLQSMEDPSEDEGDADAHSRNEMGQNRQGPRVLDMEDEHSTGRKPYAGGGRIGDDEENMDHEMELNPAHGHYSADDSEDQPHDEAIIEHAASIAAAIMAKRDRAAKQHSDSDEDDEMYMASGGSVESGSSDMNYAEGGEINEHDDAADIHSKHSIDSDSHSSQVDLSRNADEDANEEDQLSYNALRKENYSESEGLDLMESPDDSNEHGDSEESDSENKHDNKLVSAIRRKMRMKSPISR